MEADNGKDSKNNDEDGDHDNRHGLSSVIEDERGNAHTTDKVQREEVVI